MSKKRWWLVWLALAAGLNGLDATLAWLLNWNRPLPVVIVIGVSYGWVASAVADRAVPRGKAGSS